MNVDDFADIRRRAKKFARRMRFFGEEDDFASFSVAKAWELQRPIRLRFSFYAWIRERYCSVQRVSEGSAKKEESILEILGDQGEVDETENNVLGSVQNEPSCEDWVRLAREIGLRPHTTPYAIFILHFSLGYSAREIEYITGYEASHIRAFIRSDVRELGKYYDLPNRKRKRNQYMLNRNSRTVEGSI